MKIKVVSCRSPEHLEYDVDFWIKTFREKGKEIMDIQYGGCGGFIRTDWGGYYEYSAMIVYKDLEV